MHDGKALLYRASKLDCDPCSLKPKCCPNTRARKVPRDIHEAARDYARSLKGTAPCLGGRVGPLDTRPAAPSLPSNRVWLVDSKCELRGIWLALSRSIYAN